MELAAATIFPYQSKRASDVLRALVVGSISAVGDAVFLLLLAMGSLSSRSKFDDMDAQRNGRKWSHRKIVAVEEAEVDGKSEDDDDDDDEDDEDDEGEEEDDGGDEESGEEEASGEERDEEVGPEANGEGSGEDEGDEGEEGDEGDDDDDDEDDNDDDDEDEDGDEDDEEEEEEDEDEDEEEKRPAKRRK